MSSQPNIAVYFGPTSASVQSDKDISNVVVLDCLGNEAKVESPATNMFADPDGIVAVWVKAGANHSGDGPGYGQRFDNPYAECPEPEVPEVPVPPTTPPTTVVPVPEAPAPTPEVEVPVEVPVTISPEPVVEVAPLPEAPVAEPVVEVPVPLAELPVTGIGDTLAPIGTLLLVLGLAVQAIKRVMR